MQVADTSGAEIVSVDSMQVYRGMDIGTAKPSVADRARVPHHLIDLVDPADAFSVAEFQVEGRKVLESLRERDVPAVVVGGSGLHFRALVDPLEFPPSDPEVRAEVERLAPDKARRALLAADPGAAAHVDLGNPRRVARALEIHRISGETPSARAARPNAAAVRSYRSLLSVAVVGIDCGSLLPRRVERRFDEMLEAGLLEEVRELAPRLGPTAGQAVGYRQLLPVVRGDADLAAGRRRAVDATRALAGRQRTFFRRDPRVRWARWHDEPHRRVEAVLARLREAGWTS